MTQYSLWTTGKRGGDNEKLVYWQCLKCDALFPDDEEGEQHILDSHREATLFPRLNNQGVRLWILHILHHPEDVALTEPERLARMGYFAKNVNQLTAALPKDYIGAKRRKLHYICHEDFETISKKVHENITHPEKQFAGLSITGPEKTDIIVQYEVDDAKLSYLGDIKIIWKDVGVCDILIEDKKPAINSPIKGESRLEYIALHHFFRGLSLNKVTPDSISSNRKNGEINKRREKVRDFYMQGYSRSRMAEELFVSEETIKNDLRSLGLRLRIPKQ